MHATVMSHGNILGQIFAQIVELTWPVKDMLELHSDGIHQSPEHV